MKIGDIVRLKKGHSLKEFLPHNCIIDDICKNRNPSFNHQKERYHISTITGELKMTWVFQHEVDNISHIRNDKLEEIGL